MKTKLRLLLILLVTLFFFNGVSNAQLQISTLQTPQDLVQNVFLDTGVVVSNVSFTGAYSGTSYLPLAKFSNGDSTNLGISEGIVLSTGPVTGIPGAATHFLSQDLGSSGDTLLGIMAGNSSHDAAILEFDLIPFADTLRYRYVFGSEEYPEYVGSGYNDVFAFFLTGPNPAGGDYTNQNIALIPGSNIQVSINNVNNIANSQYYVDNSTGTTIIFDGFTTVLNITANVIPCQVYHIKIAISDIGDGIYDSGVFLEASSLYTDFLTFDSPDDSDTLSIYRCNTTEPIQLTLPGRINYNKVVRFNVIGDTIPVENIVTIPDSVIISPGSNGAVFSITPVVCASDTSDRFIKILTQEPNCAVDTLVIKIMPYTPMINSMNSVGSYCTSSTMSCTSQVSGGVPPYSYLWSNGSLASSTTILPSISSSYLYVTITDAATHIVDSVYVEAYPVATADFMASNTLLVLGDTLVLVNQSSNYSDLLWDFGDGTTSTIFSPNHLYSDTGMYVVSLTVSDSCGSSTVYQNIHVVDSVTSSMIVNNEMFRVYPNPSNDYFELISPVSLNNSSIEVIDIIGVKQNIVVQKQGNKAIIKGLEKRGLFFILITNETGSKKIPVIRN